MNPNTEITVNALKLSRGLKTTFEGIAMVFDSIGMEIELPDLPKAEPPVQKSPEKKPEVVREPVSEPKSEPEPQESAAQSSLTLDDIAKVIVSKVKQNQANSDAIGKLVQSFGVATVKQIPVEKYEEFVTKLAAL